jgi:cell division protein FtsB
LKAENQKPEGELHVRIRELEAANDGLKMEVAKLKEEIRTLRERPPKQGRGFPSFIKKREGFDVLDGITGHLTRVCGGNVG